MKENCETVDVVILELIKAFDTVSHRLPLLKLDKYGINNIVLLNWIKDFLYNRTMSVVIEGTESTVASVTSGVSQGSVLGPLLFLLFFNKGRRTAHILNYNNLKWKQQHIYL